MASQSSTEQQKSFAGTPEATTSHQPSQDWQETSAAAVASTAPSVLDSAAQGSLMTADSLEPNAMAETPGEIQDTQEQQVISWLYHSF